MYELRCAACGRVSTHDGATAPLCPNCGLPLALPTPIADEAATPAPMSSAEETTFPVAAEPVAAEPVAAEPVAEAAAVEVGVDDAVPAAPDVLPVAEMVVVAESVAAVEAEPASALV